LYRARNAEKLAAAKRLYRERYRTKVKEAQRRYYAKHQERLRAYYKQYNQMEHRRAWRVQYRVKRRKALAERERTLEKVKALGPLKLTIELEDCMKPIPVETYLETFCESLEVEPQPSFCELLDDSLASTPEEDKDPPCAMTITDMDHAAYDESSLSACDMWDDGRGFLDNLLEELSDLPSSSSTALYTPF